MFDELPSIAVMIPSDVLAAPGRARETFPQGAALGGNLTFSSSLGKKSPLFLQISCRCSWLWDWRAYWVDGYQAPRGGSGHWLRVSFLRAFLGVFSS